MKEPTKRQLEVLADLHLNGEAFIKSRIWESLHNNGWIFHAGMRTWSQHANGNSQLRAVYDISLYGLVALGIIPEPETTDEPNGDITCEQRRHMGGRPYWEYRYGDWKVECEKPFSFGGAVSMVYLDMYIVKDPTGDDVFHCYDPAEAVDKMVELAHG
jgi:hypothetical protein